MVWSSCGHYQWNTKHNCNKFTSQQETKQLRYVVIYTNLRTYKHTIPKKKKNEPNGISLSETTFHWLGISMSLFKIYQQRNTLNQILKKTNSLLKKLYHKSTKKSREFLKLRAQGVIGNKQEFFTSSVLYRSWHSVSTTIFETKSREHSSMVPVTAAKLGKQVYSHFCSNQISSFCLKYFAVPDSRAWLLYFHLLQK